MTTAQVAFNILAALSVGVPMLALAVSKLRDASRYIDDRRAETATLDELLDGGDLETWRDDLDNARPDGCICTWPATGPDQSHIGHRDCPLHAIANRRTANS